MTHAWCPGTPTGRIHHRRINPPDPSPPPPVGPWRKPRYASIVALTALSLHLAGCASYKSIVTPVPRLMEQWEQWNNGVRLLLPDLRNVVA